MYDFNKVSGIHLTTDWILSKISQEEIFFYYNGPFKLNRSFSSSLRKDRHPSCRIYFSKNGRLIYEDFAQGERYNCFAFVQKLYNSSFREALKIIAKDFGLINESTKVVSKEIITEALSLEKEHKASTLIQFEPEPWNEKNLFFWRLYEITQQELERENIFPVKQLFINKKEIFNFSQEPRYAYPIEYEGKHYVKIYSPYSKQMKWISSIPNNIPFGLNSLSYDTDLLLITKSKKDQLILSKIFKDVISLQNESENAFPISIQEELLSKYKQCVIVFDADEVGVRTCKEYNKKGFGYFNTPRQDYEKYRIKDPSDYVKFYGIEALKELFIQKNLL